MVAPKTMAEAVSWLRIGLAPDVGFRVHFEEVDGIFLRSGYWPDHGEELLPTEEIAWAYARAFANPSTFGRFVNVYVVDRQFSPVSSYRSRMIENRAPREVAA